MITKETRMQKNKILIFNGYYTPAKNYGGPLTSIRNVVKTCSDKYIFYIVSYNHDVGSKTKFDEIKEGWQPVDGATVKYVNDGELDFRYNRLKQLIKEINPDLIWFSGILRPHTKLFTLLLGRELGIPVLMSPRGEVSADRIIIKAFKKKVYLFLTKHLGFYKKAWFHATSEDEIIGLKRYIGASDGHIFLVPNISVPAELPRYSYDKKADTLKVVFISRIHHVKNLLFAVKVICKLTCKVCFDVYGPLEQPEYWDECEKVAKAAPTNVTIRYCGQVEPMEVGKTFRQYDCFLFPTLNENYGHAIAEALANSCPVILSKGTTPWDSLDGRAGYICNQNDIDDFLSKLNKITKMANDEYKILMTSTLSYYSDVLKHDEACMKHQNMFSTIITSQRNNG